jgi:hypothetical protein
MTNVSAPFRVLFLVLACALTGCAARRAESFQPVQLEPDKAVLYIFRPDSGRGGDVETFINSVAAGELDRGQYRAHILEPGEYLVRAESRSSMVRSVTVIPGDAAYLMVKVERRGRCVIEVPEPELARRLIAGMRKAAADEPARTASR